MTNISHCMSLSAYLLDVIVISSSSREAADVRRRMTLVDSSGRSSRAGSVLLGDALKQTRPCSGRFALTGVAAGRCCGWPRRTPGRWGWAGLTVQSALGEALRAEIDVTSLTPEEAATLRVRVAPPEAYRAAGVDYNAVLPGTQVDAAAPRRRPPLPAPDQRPRGAGAVRRRDPRDHLGHAAAWCASTRCCSTRRRRARRRRRRRHAAPVDRRRRRRAAAPRPRRAGAGACAAPVAPRPPRRAPRPRAATRCRAAPAAAPAPRCGAAPTSTGCAGRHAVAHRRHARSAPASRSTRCWCRCSAPTRGLRRRQHEPAEGRRRC